jgi:prevent-host-death family protein
VFVSVELTTNQKGAIAEEAIATEATRLGIVVCRPNTDARYDLVFDLGPRLLRVQCKWASLQDDVIRVSVRGSWFSPGRGYVRSAYSGTEVDAVAAYCQARRECYLLPIDVIAGQTQVHLRLAPARNGQRAALHLAADYPLGAVAQLEERLAGSEEVRGSSPLSSTSPRLAETVGAHEFRNRFGWYLERAAAGEEIRISRHGRAHARLCPDRGKAAPLGS